MNNEEEIKDKLLKLFEEIDRQSDEQELYIRELLKVMLRRAEEEKKEFIEALSDALKKEWEK